MQDTKRKKISLKQCKLLASGGGGGGGGGGDSGDGCYYCMYKCTRKSYTHTIFIFPFMIDVNWINFDFSHRQNKSSWINNLNRIDLAFALFQICFIYKVSRVVIYSENVSMIKRAIEYFFLILELWK